MGRVQIMGMFGDYNMATITKPKAQVKKGAKGAAPMAIHAHTADGVHHFVGLKDIRVVIVPNDGAYFAQGIDLDYAAQGDSVDKVKENFENGLHATIEQHLKVFGNLKNLIQVAPPEICQHLLLNSSAQFKLYWQVSAHEVHDAFVNQQTIKYLVAAAETATVC